MNLLRKLWNDESGAILSAEAVMVGTVAIAGAGVGLHSIGHAVNEEMEDVSGAIRSLDQSYSYKGFKSCRAETAGSSFTQPERKEHHRDRGERHHHRPHPRFKRDGGKREEMKRPPFRRPGFRRPTDAERTEDTSQPEQSSKPTPGGS